MTNANSSDLLDADGARAYLGGADHPISRATLYRGIAEGRFPKPMKVGKLNRWKREWLDEVHRRAVANRDAA